MSVVSFDGGVGVPEQPAPLRPQVGNEASQHHFRVPLSAVDLHDAERAYVNSAVESGWISGTGPFVHQFETRLADRIQRPYVIAVANGTLALELALRALDVGPGDEVIVPVLTFAAPALSVLAVRASPILVDVSPASWTLCPHRVAEAITARTRAIIAVDVLGHPADYDALTGLGVPVIEDAAEAHGAHYKGAPVGSFGDIAIFSFHANKAIATGEGGCVATDSAELADRMRLIANHGMHPDRPYVHEIVGRNYRMTNVVAAIGLGQLDRWDELIGNRKRVSSAYERLLEGTGCLPRPVADWADYSCWLHTVQAANRDEIVAMVRRHGVDARAIWPLLSTQPLFGVTDRSFSVAEAIADTAFWLPTYSGLTVAEIEFVADAVRAALVPRAG
jgi:perosamine synthetase